MSRDFTPTHAEIALTNAIFAQADPQKVGILTGEVAVRLFGGAKLTPIVLGEIWSIADEENNGWLSKKGVAVALRLMGHAQKGERISKSLLSKPVPVPTIEGVPASILQHNTGSTTPRSPPPGLPALTQQDKTKFQALFMRCGPVNGLVPGDRVKEVFVKSNLPNDKLLQIWNLADTQDRGALDLTDFIIGMYLIQASMYGQLSFMPSNLPPGLYEQAGGKSRSSTGSIIADATSGSGSHYSPPHALGPPPIPARSPIQSQITSQSPPKGILSTGPRLPARPPLNQGAATITSPFRPPTQSAAWDVTPAAKAGSDRYFDTLDKERKGYISGEVGGPFLMQSNLDSGTLATIWDLADINNDGLLTRDGFAVAMHLIQSKIAGKEIPPFLPLSLVPPSMRGNAGANASSPFAPPPAPEPQPDLLWDSPPISPTASAPSTATMKSPSGGGIGTPATVHPTQLDPFGSSFVSTSSSKNLLEDDEDFGQKSLPLQDTSAEYGNTQNQLNSTNRSLEMAKADRAAAEQTLSTQASELAALQTQLSSAKAAYETTMSQLTTLRSRVATQTAEIQKKKEELITAESDLSALLIEKSEVEGALLRDKEEARGLHRKMVEMGQQVEGLKTEIEKSRKEAKQQKGLLAIARKQLSTKEAEKAKMMHELGEANGELAAVTREKEETEAELAKETPIATLSDRPDVFRSESLMSAAAHSLPGSHGTTTPVRSDSPAQGKSNNPFERLTKSSTTPTPRSQSPFMPFADAFTPKDAHAVNGVPDSAAATMPQDPFGFAQALAVVEPASLETGPDVFGQMPRPAMAATSPPPKDSLPASGSDTSADDSFITTASTPPPREPVSRSTIENEIASRFPDLGGEAVQFPALVSRRASEGLDHSNDHAETDIMARLQDLDVNDSDSDSDDDKPLANLKSEMTQPDARPLAPNGEPSSAFDDAFELTPRVTTPDIPKPAAPAAQPVVPPAEPKDAFSVAFGIPPGTFSSGAPELQLSSNPPPAPAAPTVVDGVDAFDEALGKISASGSTLPQLTFDAFDDNFDFTSVSEMTMSPSPSLPPLSAAAVNGKAADDAFVMVPSANGGIGDGPSSGRLKKPAFEDVFGPMAPYIPPVAGKSPTTTQNAPTISFDAAATERPPSQLSKPMGSSSASAIVSPQAEASSQSAASPKSENFSMQKATGQMSPSSTRTTSPPPSGSPKTSRESRPSTSSSSKNDHLHPEPKSKEPRHHKLSLRLPFRRKKDHPPPPPPAAQSLAPPAEEDWAGSGDLDDDAPHVRQLRSMGFSRDAAVAALEHHQYDFAAALNELLPSQGGS